MNDSDQRRPFASLIAGLPLAALAAAAPAWAEDAGKGIAASLQPFVDSHALAGAVTLVASKDAVLATQAVGCSDLAAKTPMAPDDLFWIASMSKPMTAAALMMLVDEGKVDVEADVAKYLPEFNGQMLVAEHTDERTVLRKPAHPIKVREILSHTSGLPFMSRLEPGRVDTMSLREAVISYAMTPLKTEPGSAYDYSNAGINTAGRIVEVVSGMPYEEFMQQRLFAPLGMKDTTLWPSEEQLKRLAKSYKPNAEKNGLEEIRISQLTYPLSDHHRGPSPAGGYFSTAADMAQFGRMILAGGTFLGHRYLSEAAIKTMTSKQTGALPNGYGFGWSVDNDGCGHGGAYATDLWLDLPHQLVMVYLVQHAGYAGADGHAILHAFRKSAVAAFAK